MSSQSTPNYSLFLTKTVVSTHEKDPLLDKVQLRVEIQYYSEVKAKSINVYKRWKYTTEGNSLEVAKTMVNNAIQYLKAFDTNRLVSFDTKLLDYIRDLEITN
jgi:hypothetical protein